MRRFLFPKKSLNSFRVDKNIGEVKQLNLILSLLSNEIILISKSLSSISKKDIWLIFFSLTKVSSLYSYLSLKDLSIQILAKTLPKMSGKYFLTSSLFFKIKSLSTNSRACFASF